jgi:hypothetical protein
MMMISFKLGISLPWYYNLGQITVPVSHFPINNFIPMCYTTVNSYNSQLVGPACTNIYTQKHYTGLQQEAQSANQGTKKLMSGKIK